MTEAADRRKSNDATIKAIAAAVSRMESNLAEHRRQVAERAHLADERHVAILTAQGETNAHLGILNGRTSRSETRIDAAMEYLKVLDLRVSTMADQFTWFRGLTAPIRLAWAVSRHKALTAALLLLAGALGGGVLGGVIAAGQALLVEIAR